MGVMLTFGCYLAAFAPSAALFVRFIAPDPLRIILFVLGSFLWLVALLVSSLSWLLLSLFAPLSATVVLSIVLQEATRIFYFWMLKKAQHGLNKMTRPGTASVAPGVSDLHNARHMLALVCGLGMGVMASLFLTMNVFAEFSGPGSVGLPRALELNSRPSQLAGEYLPLYYALSASILTLLHVTWTIMVWDSCHHVSSSTHRVWPLPALLALVSHVAVSAVSHFNSTGYQPVVLSFQLTVLLLNIMYCHYIMGGTISTLGAGALSAFSDWLSLAWIRRNLSKSANRYQVEEHENRMDEIAT